MQPTTIIVLACLVAVVAANTEYVYPVEDSLNMPADQVYESINDTPVHERSSRTKRGLLLLKKKLLLGALGLKAAKVGAVGAGVAAIALKKQSVHHPRHQSYIHGHGPAVVEVHSWSG
ncbi:uncharacterized protein LOC119829283 isoform X1 [Zerene cesonia]|uniref:uncharacterized protein LOC119829283 isoform X1 n=1 Tax=Zerene cesonia TaxID=33412 RepID=UPI0018E4F54C|nr:uncharacterized protein LOC119829283 isoform X1 [Zerene cesonia]